MTTRKPTTAKKAPAQTQDLAVDDDGALEAPKGAVIVGGGDPDSRCPETGEGWVCAWFGEHKGPHLRLSEAVIQANPHIGIAPVA